MKISPFFSPHIYHVLATAIEITHADKGNIQFYDEKEKTLKIAAHIGFNDDFLNLFKSVPIGHCACGVALEKKQRIIVEDVFEAPSFSHIGPILKKFGFTSVQSSPLLDSNGKLYGILSTHFSQKRRPSEEDIHSLDTYLKVAAPILARKMDKYNSIPITA